MPEDDADGKVKRTARIALDTGDYSDYDLVAFASDPDGTRGAEAGRSTASPPPLGSSSDESLALQITTTSAAASVWVLLEIVHWLPADAQTTTLTF